MDSLVIERVWVLGSDVGEFDVCGGSRQVLEREEARDGAHAEELGVVDLDGIECLGVDVHVRRGATNLIGVTFGWVEADTFDGPPAELRRSLIVR